MLPELVRQAEQVLGLTPSQRRRTIYRIDGGGGSIGIINGLLRQDYAVATKDYSFRRTQVLAKSITAWVADSAQPTREMGWVSAESTDYEGSVKRLAVRSKSTKGPLAVRRAAVCQPLRLRGAPAHGRAAHHRCRHHYAGVPALL